MERRGGPRRARGFAFIVVSLMILAAGVFFDPLFGDTLEYYQRLGDESARESERQVRAAKDALTNYMLTRALDRGWAKIRLGVSYIEPRFLMLPCPDNVVEIPRFVDLDGTQDPTCGHMSERQPLASGSRFGRLPWNFSGIAPSGEEAEVNDIGDGLGRDFKDGSGNRLWYAVSRNFAPLNQRTDAPHPLNLHTIPTIESHWLTVVNESGNPVANRVAAVVLSPGRPKWGQARLSEDVLSRAKLKSNDKRVSADLYFEKVTLRNGRAVQNYENDGKFIGASKLTEGQTNDRLAFLSLDEMLSPDSRFMRQYKAQVGIRRTQNDPLFDSPLDAIQKWVSAHYDFFGFYPTPAALSSDSNVETRLRHCAEWKIPSATVAFIPEGSALLTPAAVKATVVTVAAGMSTFRLSSAAEFLAAERITIALTASFMRDVTVVMNDAETVAAVAFVGDFSTVTVTLARLARMILKKGETLAISSSLTARVGRRMTISTGISVYAPVTIRALLPNDSLLAPNGVLFGLLPEHSRTTLTAGQDGRNLTAGAVTRAGFMHPGAVLTVLSEPLTIMAGDKLYYPFRGRIKLEKDHSEEDLATPYKFEKLILDRPGFPLTTLLDASPSEETRRKRGLVILMTTDALRSSRPVRAPAVVYPWREQAGRLARTRDNLHPYPPCFDSRDILEDSHRLFIEDQPMHYAVAANCHYGGKNCGGPGGLTVAVGAGVGFALPSDYAASGDYEMTLSAGNSTSPAAIFAAVVSIRSGTIATIRVGNAAPSEVSLVGAQWIQADEEDNARARVASGFPLTVFAALTFPAGTPFMARNTAVAEVRDAHALLMYSPGPLRSTRCVLGVSSPTTVTINGVRLTLSDQRRDPADIDLRAPCGWLDLDENADGDGFFAIPPPRESPRHPDFNDYFLLFGGSVTIRVPVR